MWKKKILRLSLFRWSFLRWKKKIQFPRNKQACFSILSRTEVQPPALLGNGNFPPCTRAQMEWRGRVNPAQWASSSPTESAGRGKEGRINWVNWELCKRGSHQLHTVEPIPLYFHNDVSCFKFNHLKIMIFRMIFLNHFSCVLFA